MKEGSLVHGGDAWGRVSNRIKIRWSTNGDQVG